MRVLLCILAIVTASSAVAQPVKEPSVGCIDTKAISLEATPIGIYQGMADCVKASKYESATMLFALGGAYTKFDTLRVADKSAHQAATVLKMLSLQDVPESNKEAFMKTFEGYTKQGSTEHKTMCAAVAAKGPPAYVPSYMVNHGMSAYMSAMNGTEKEEPLVPNFDAKASWNETLKTYLHCE